MWVHTCKRVHAGPERPYKSGPSPVLPQLLSAMNQAELPLSESAGGEPAAAAAGTRGRQRRARTAFTSEQVCRLEKTFQCQKYLGASERRKLASALRLSEIQIKTWFQNRRMKLKRQIQDHRYSLLSPAPLYSHPVGTPPALLQDGLQCPFHGHLNSELQVWVMGKDLDVLTHFT
uniref:Homeobox domain-containing protein n=1 Tax=Falco tinnunculus TaxID=100819 RepID=A0A8C4U8V0_FALTI